MFVLVFLLPARQRPSKTAAQQPSKTATQQTSNRAKLTNQGLSLNSFPQSLNACKPPVASAGCAKRKQSARPLGQGVLNPRHAYHSLPIPYQFLTNLSLPGEVYPPNPSLDWLRASRRGALESQKIRSKMHSKKWSKIDPSKNYFFLLFLWFWRLFSLIIGHLGSILGSPGAFFCDFSENRKSG